jgi:hypothetical protein
MRYPGEQNGNLRRKKKSVKLKRDKFGRRTKKKDKNGTVFKQVVANSFVMFS